MATPAPKSALIPTVSGTISRLQTKPRVQPSGQPSIFPQLQDSEPASAGDRAARGYEGAWAHGPTVREA